VSAPVLHLRHLYHRYGVTEVLADVGLDVIAGETLALVGPSGCGKSTLLHVVAGLLTPSEVLMRSTFRGVSCVFQQPRLMPWKTALDNIALSLKALGVPKRARRNQAAAWGARLGLNPQDLEKYPHALSGGMQSRVALARALAPQPDLLLLDEPFAALDVGLKTALYGLLSQTVRATDMAVLMITHDLMEAVQLADRILMMVPEPGRIVHAFDLHTPQAQRDSVWVYQTTAELMQVDAVRMGFGLPASGEAPVALAAQRAAAAARPAGSVA